MKSSVSNSTGERLYLLDGMALAYRAYFSFIARPLINSKGENTSAIFGFVNTLMKILNDDKPDHIAVVFDTKEPTFRHIMYQPYKATREKMPEDMSSQLDKLKEVVKAFNVPCIELPGYEADDIMGTLARRAELEGIDTFLVTGDKDFMQLISPRIKIYRPGKGGDGWEIVDEKGVLEKFGVAPNFVVDVLGLTGDKSDNVPGVYGIGEKSAIPLVQQFGTIERILESLDQIPQKGVREKIGENMENARLSKKLVTIDTNVPLDVDLRHLNAKPRDSAKLARLFAELEFRSLQKKMIAEEIPLPVEPVEPDVSTLEHSDISSDPHDYHLVATEKELKVLVRKLEKSSVFSFDSETSGLDPLQAEIVGLSFAIGSGEAWYVAVKPGEKRRDRVGVRERASVEKETASGEADLFSDADMPLSPGPVAPATMPAGKQTARRAARQTPKSDTEHPESEIASKGTPGGVREPAFNNQPGVPLEFVLTSLSPVLTNPRIKKIGQNIKYDMLVLAAHGVRIAGVEFDTMVASYVLRPDGQHNLDALAAEHLRYKMITYDELTGTGKDRRALRDIDVKAVADYSAQDADITFRLYKTLTEKLEHERLLKLCEKIEFPLIGVLADMELAGICLDVGYLANLSKEMERMLDTLTSDIYSLCGEKFNINSTQQLSKILFDKLQLPVARKTKTGYSTDVAVLESLRQEHPAVEKLLEYRQLQKLKSTYVDSLPLLVNPGTGRVHTSFNQAVASTGRLSSSDPNLQNIPIRTEIGRSIRKAFIPGNPNLRIMSADYSQIELRIMAHVSGDKGLSEAFLSGEDIHSTTAARVFSIPLKDVNKELRRKSKEINYGIMYGIGPFGLATRLGISQTEAKALIARYFERFPKVNQYILDTLEKARQNGYVSTLLGRRRYLSDVNSRNFNVRGNAERQAVNMPIQGSAADMIKIAMIKIHNVLREEKIDATMLLQVHDELVFEVAESEEQRAREVILREMQQALPLSVPVEVEIGVGNNWLEAH